MIIFLFPNILASLTPPAPTGGVEPAIEPAIQSLLIAVASQILLHSRSGRD